MPTALGVPGYIGPIVVLTVSYALFQTANNTSVMAEVAADQRGVISGLLNLSRNLGLITGGAVFSRFEDLATGMRATFGVAALLIFAALAIAAGRKG